MSAWIVYSKDGKTERCRLKALEYSGSFMADRAVTATFEHHSEVAFEVFDYIVYRGEKFELESVPSVKKTSSDRYEYELRFVSLKYELERCEMRDIVPNDNGVVYPTPLTFSFTGDVRYLAERIQVNLDALYGEGVWHISVAENTTSEEKNITIGQQNCWNALSLVNTTYGLNFSVRGREVLIGGELDSVNHEFQYGKGNGLYEIERASDTEIGIVTKLRAYGGTRNLDYSYPKKPEWADSVLPVSFALSPLRLMLPSFKEDGKTDFVLADEATIAKYGIRESSIIYEDIYPSITGATNANGEAIDEIAGVDEIDETKNTFTVYLRNLGFDLNEHLTTSEAQISMKTGTLQGYTFTITAIELLGDGRYKLTLGRNSLENSEESGAYVPSKNWNMKAGDKFVLLNILMPQAYIREAEARLLVRAKEYLAEYGKTNFSYNVGLHDKFLVEHPSVYNSLIEGVKLRVHDSELGISEDVIIQSITITENSDDNILPQVKVTLNNKPSASTLDRIQGKLNDVIAETSANNFSSQNELMAQYRKKLDKPFFDKLFVAIDKDGNEIASNDVVTPVSYIKAKYSIATVGGVTMYAEGDVEVPTLAEGLPFDQRTIWFNPETKQIEVIGGTGGGGTGGGGEGGVSNFWDLSGIPSWITSTKPTYSYSEILGTPDLSGYATISSLNAVSTKLNDFLEGSDTDTVINKWKELETFLSGLTESDNLATILTGKADKSYVDTNFVTIAGTEDVTGLHNFVNGLKIGGVELIKKQDDVVYLDGNLVVKGGITMYGDGEGGSSIPSYSTLGSLLNVDESNDAVASVDRVLFQSAGSNVWSWKALSEIGGGSSGGGSVSGAVRYLSTLGSTGSWYDSTYRLYGEWGLHDRLYLKTEGGYDVVANLAEKDGNGNVIASTYLPLSGGTLTGNLVFGTDSAGISFTKNGSAYGALRLSDDNEPSWMYSKTWAWETIIHSGNYSSYALPLSGGTLTGTLTIAPSNGQSLISERASGVPYISFRRSSSEYYGHIGVNSTGDPIMQSTVKGSTAWEKIWYEGNDGSGSGLDADLLDGVHAAFMFYARNKTITSSNVNSLMDNGVYYTAGYAPISDAYGYGTFLNFRSNAVGVNSRQAQFYIVDGAQVERGGRIYFRDSWNSTDDITTPWYEIITSKRIGEYNAGSATKLQTARTIWGQSFDGTANVSGGLSSVGKITYTNASEQTMLSITNGNYPFSMVYKGNQTKLYNVDFIGTWGSQNSISFGCGGGGNPLYAQTAWMTIVEGNVGIGTTNPSTKLHVVQSQWGNGITIDRSENQAGACITACSNGKRLGEFGVNGELKFQVAISPSIGSSASLKFQVDKSGNVLAYGGVTMYSDQRKKTILNHVELSLKQIADAPLIEHYYNSDQNKTTHVGSIAQYWAGLNDWFCKLDNEGFYTMEIQNCALASAISIARHLEKYESKTDKTIRKMKKRIQELEDEVERLKKN